MTIWDVLGICLGMITIVCMVWWSVTSRLRRLIKWPIWSLYFVICLVVLVLRWDIGSLWGALPYLIPVAMFLGFAATFPALEYEIAAKLLPSETPPPWRRAGEGERSDRDA